jgi:hypothetical protein
MKKAKKKDLESLEETERQRKSMRKDDPSRPDNKVDQMLAEAIRSLKV